MCIITICINIGHPAEDERRSEGMQDQKKNYQKELEKYIVQLEKEGTVPSLLLHSCCGPCSSYVMEYLSRYFHITVFYYNPNITEREEYEKRAAEQKRLIEKMNAGFRYPAAFLEGEYDAAAFFKMARGMEMLPEGGERCFRCYEMRLRRTAKEAKERGFGCFATTLTISPMKNAQKLNEIGGQIAEETGVRYLFSDFKKKNGYKRSVELSQEYGMYRQDYCGCVFSKRDRIKALQTTQNLVN